MNALRTASIISFAMAIAKGSAFAMSGSLVVLASFLDSFMDAILSWINFKMSHAAQESADRQHPYGHGGFEVIGAMLQGFLIAGSGGLIIFQTLDRLFSPTGSQNLKLDQIPLALGIMIASTIGGGIITFILSKARRKNADKKKRSLSLNADHAHYTGDAIQNGIGVIGLIITIYTQNSVVDSITGILSACILLKTAIPLVRDSFADIMNQEFDPKLQEQVQKIVLGSNIPEVKGMHRLRSRTLGPKHFVDFHLKLPNDIPLIDAHEISYEIESLIKHVLPNIDIMIHLDPESEPDDDEL
jgi:ferrous-iron efflux pump FieF